MLEEVVVTGLRAFDGRARKARATTSCIACRCATDLNARQTKQVAFLQKPEVKVDRFYSLRFATD